MTMRWALYDESGAIIQVYTGPESEAELQGWQYIPILDGLDDSTSYVDAEAVLPKLPFSLAITQTTISANGTDEAVISGIPAGATVEWPDGQIDEVTDGEVRLSVDLPGTYTLIFDAVPYLRQEVTIEAVAAT